MLPFSTDELSPFSLPLCSYEHWLPRTCWRLCVWFFQANISLFGDLVFVVVDDDVVSLFSVVLGPVSTASYARQVLATELPQLSFSLL